MNEATALQNRHAVGGSDLKAVVMRLAADDGVPLEEMLLMLAKYGEPRLSLQGNGWYCAIEMRVSSVGVQFKVASEFGCKSPGTAAAECCARVEKTLSDLGA